MSDQSSAESPKSQLANGLLWACALWLVLLGLYFALLRPPMLPEDLRFIGMQTNSDTVPAGLSRWLQVIFVVLGGFMISNGLLLAYILRSRHAAHPLQMKWILAAAGLCSVGLMSLINFEIGSDFRWLLLLPPIAWGAGLLLSRR
jgi:hypothetical protein